MQRATNTAVQTEVLKAHPTEFDITGQRLSISMFTAEESISTGLANRLVRYATGEMAESGFAEMAKNWKILVYTVDGDRKPADRSYCVRWTNEKGGYIEVIGILTSKGWPSLSHGFDIGID